MKRIFKTYGVFALTTLMLLSITSCKTTSRNVIYADYVAFGDNVKANYKIDSRKSKGKSYKIYDKETGNNQTFELQKELMSVQQEDNTAGIYAMDKGLDRIKYVRKKIFKKDPNTKYYVIFMTDGLDNISVQVAKNEKRKNYKTSDKYKKKLRKKIVKVSRCNKKEKNDFNIYPIVFTGTDLGDMRDENRMSEKDFKDYISENMDWLRGSSKGVQNSPEVIHSDNFEIIKKKFEEVFRASNFEFAVPKGYVNKKIKMELKGTVGGDTDTISTYFTAVLKNKGKKYYLTDIKLYGGLTTAEKNIEGKKYKLYATNNKDKKGTLSTFVLDRPIVKLETEPEAKSYFVLPIEDSKNPTVRQLTAEYNPKNPNAKDMWVRNSEYDSQLKSMANAYIQLIVDCSKSLGLKEEADNQFIPEIKTAREIVAFIRNMAVGAEEKSKK